MEKSIKHKIKKQDLILFAVIWIFTMLVNNAFLQRHYSSDTMCLIYHGYFEYPTHYFLLDGRIFSTLMCYLGGILGLPFDTYLFISNFIGIALLSLTFVILFKFIISYLDIKNNWIRFLVLLSVYTIILNHMSLEYLLYPESCIMCVSMLCCVLATKTYLKKGKNSLIKSFVLLVIATLCYQGLISIFPTLVITLGLLKIKKDNKEKLKIFIKELFKVGIMFGMAMLISALLIVIFNYLLQDSSNRIEKIVNSLNYLKQIPKETYYILLKQCDRIPENLSILVMLITTLIIVNCNSKLDLFIKYILSILVAYMFSIIPIAFYGYTTARILMSIGSTMGISLLFVIITLNNEKEISLKNFKTVIITIGVISYFIFNVVNNYICGYEHLKAFKIDEEMGKEIAQIVKEYEEETGKEIKKFAYCYDVYSEPHSKGIKRFGSFTERKFAMPWCITESVSYYCNKKLEGIYLSPEVFLTYFIGKNYMEFSKEQIVFIDDTMNMCVY